MNKAKCQSKRAETDEQFPTQTVRWPLNDCIPQEWTRLVHLKGAAIQLLCTAFDGPSQAKKWTVLSKSRCGSFFFPAKEKTKGPQSPGPPLCPNVLLCHEKWWVPKRKEQFHSLFVWKTQTSSNFILPHQNYYDTKNKYARTQVISGANPFLGVSTKNLNFCDTYTKDQDPGRWTSDALLLQVC